ncbi:hypothetical protein [Streptomyces formicae]|uniref:hypothetical protein n=1 Tax=Streptomyces formicae TaxID=1616117 RepID=UPI003614FA3A
MLSLHPAGRDAGTALIAENRMRWMVGAPMEDTICAMHLMLEGIPSRYPRLRIVHSHLGGGGGRGPPGGGPGREGRRSGRAERPGRWRRARTTPAPAAPTARIRRRTAT